MEPNSSPPPKQNSANPKQQATERLKQAENVLVTVSSNPSVDQLAACIGLTLLLNKLGKHGTAVYSGETPSTIEFLKPEETLEKNTDSLRDFIIALDKSKADKLRYKVEDKIVQIFITPYRASLSEKDLDFSLGDFNVDAVVALGVHKQEELDQAITAHGRILHDATIITINTTPNNDLGSINWQDAKSSSLSEMVAALGNSLGKNVFDDQIATALLTGIVAATDRFSNDKTFSDTMNISAQMIAAGANQQLVATKLKETEPKSPPSPPVLPVPTVQPLPPTTAAQQPPAAPEPPKTQPSKPDDGTLLISHKPKTSDANQKAAEDEEREITSLDAFDLDDEEKEEAEPISQIDIDQEGTLRPIEDYEKTASSVINAIQPSQPIQPAPGPSAFNSNYNVTGGSPMIQNPPTLADGTLTANSQVQGLDPSTDPLSLPTVDSPMLNRDNQASYGLSSNHLNVQPFQMVTPPVQAPNLPPMAPMAAPIPGNGPLPDLDSARKTVDQLADNPIGQLKPLDALNARPVFENLHQLPAMPGGGAAPTLPGANGRSMLSMPLPPTSALGGQGQTTQGEDTPSGAPQPTPSSTDPGAPPAVPPPMTDLSSSSFL